MRDPESLGSAEGPNALQDPESMLVDDENPMLGDKFYSDDDMPAENEYPVRASHPDDDLEDGPRVNDRRRPKKPTRKIPKSPHSRDHPQYVPFISPNINHQFNDSIPSWNFSLFIKYHDSL